MSTATAGVCAGWGRCVCRGCAGRARRGLVVVVCVLLAVVGSSFPAAGWRLLAGGILLRRTVCVEQSS